MQEFIEDIFMVKMWLERFTINPPKNYCVCKSQEGSHVSYLVSHVMVILAQLFLESCMSSGKDLPFLSESGNIMHMLI